MNSSPKISVIMSAYNAAETIEKAVRSVLAQSFEDFELIIIDDGSNDDTPVLLDSLANEDQRIRIIRHENKGLTRSLNIGLKAAKGELIARLDCDDYALPDRFMRQVSRFDAEDDLVLLGGNSIDEYDNGNTGEWGYYPDVAISKRVLLCTPFPHSTAMMRAAPLKELGGYDPRYKTSQDTELWMRFAKKGRISMIKDPLIRRSVHRGSISNKRKLRQFYDVLRARLAHYPGSKLYSIVFSIRGLMLAFLPQSAIQALKNFLGK